MTKLHDLLITDVIDASTTAFEAEHRWQQWAEQRNELTRHALLNGVTVEQLASALSVPVALIEQWADVSSNADS